MRPTSIAAVESGIVVDGITVSAYTIPTEAPESDGTLEWESTTIVIAEVSAGGEVGLGYTYADVAAAKLIDSRLAGIIEGRDPMAVEAAWSAMVAAVRNVGRPGIASSAIAAVDTALWDLKARLLGLPLATVLGRFHDAVPVYGSGGFTSYSIDALQRQLAGGVEQGIPAVKMKVGREPKLDAARVRAAREAVGDADLMVDANGAYPRKQALAKAEEFARSDV